MVWRHETGFAQKRQRGPQSTNESLIHSDISKSASKFSEVLLPNILRRRWRHADRSRKQFIISVAKTSTSKAREYLREQRVMSKWVFMEVSALMLTSRGRQLKSRLEWIFPKNSLPLVLELGGCLLLVFHSLTQMNHYTSQTLSPAGIFPPPLCERLRLPACFIQWISTIPFYFGEQQQEAMNYAILQSERRRVLNNDSRSLFRGELRRRLLS